MSRPSAGARYLLELDRVDGERATYRATVFLPDTEYTGTALLDEAGAADVSITAPEELAHTLEMLAKLTARGAAKRKEDGLPTWPQRLLRWRGPGRGE